MNAQAYLSLFQERRLPIVVDDPQTGSLLTTLGFSSIPFEVYNLRDEAQAPVLLLITCMDMLESLRQLWDTSRVPFAHLALARFDPSDSSIRYSLAQLLSLDFHRGLERRAQAYQQLFSSSRVEVTTGAGICTVHTRDEVEVANPGSTLEPGRLYSITEFLEASMVNIESDTSSFSVEGQFEFEGLIFLCNNQDQREAFGRDLDGLLRLARRGENRVRFSHNRIVELVIGGEERTDFLTGLMGGRERDTSVTEVGIGCAEYKVRPDFSINSVVNKVTAGVYMGIGMGWQFPHIDLIAPRAVCQHFQ